VYPKKRAPLVAAQIIMMMKYVKAIPKKDTNIFINILEKASQIEKAAQEGIESLLTSSK